MTQKMQMRLKSSACFFEAIRALRDHGWIKGQQKDLAARIGYTQCHLSHVFKGNREAGAALQEAIAQDMGMTIEDMLRIGRNILDGHGFVPFIGQIDHLPANSEAQAYEIVRLTQKQFGIEGFLSGYRPAGWQDFLDGKKTPGEFYEAYADELKRLIAALGKKKKVNAHPLPDREVSASDS